MPSLEVFMIPLSSASAMSGGLTWKKISCSRSYELKLNDQLVGTLSRPSFWSSDFVAETQNGSWTFRKTGFLGNGAEVFDSTSQQDSASQQPIATFKAEWGGGSTLTFTDGQSFRLQSKGWWRPLWSVIGEAGQPVIVLDVRDKTVDVPAAGAVPDSRLSLLIMFTWYRVLKAEEDASAVVLVAAVS
jgi:hypothetical protein